MYNCPNCKTTLKKINNTYKCLNNHSFDIAKEGYVNLLLNQPKAGDNKQMIKSRNQFLHKGYFDNLVIEVIKTIDDLTLDNPCILDVGCADGYYPGIISKTYPNIIGMDISKDAIKLAAKTYKKIDFFVASGKDIPIKNNSISIILNIFSPHFLDEFLRILKPNGYIIKITPNENHLLELKQVIYDDVYLTKEKLIEDSSLKLINSNDLNYKVTLDNEDILNLITMTPYFYKTNDADLLKLEKLNRLNITLDFKIAIYKKNILLSKWK